MIQFDEKKLAKLHSAGELLEAKYGAEGTECRRKFEDEARSYYYGVILRDRRRELKMTQQQLADKLVCGQNTIYKWLRKDIMPNLCFIMLMSDIFNVSTDYLIYGTESR